ncbi:hypothetical protein ROTAS13_04312 [Roseomonas sp. TAS13]|nr:hypothetical protein ROTAS13_04312 [Roseomonas sp. TAS13]
MQVHPAIRRQRPARHARWEWRQPVEGHRHPIPGPQAQRREVGLHRHLALAAVALQLDFHEPLNRGSRGGERELHVPVDRLAAILGDVVAGEQRRRIGWLPGRSRLDIDGTYPVEEIPPRARADDGDVTAQIIRGERGGRQRRRPRVDVDAAARHDQRARHGGDQLAGDGDLALAERDGAVDRVAALGGAIAPAHDFVADVGRGHERRQVDVRPGRAPAKGRRQVPGEAQRGIVGPAGGAGARIENGVRPLDDGGQAGRAGGEGLGPQLEPHGEIGPPLATVRGGPLATGVSDEIGIGALAGIAQRAVDAQQAGELRVGGGGAIEKDVADRAHAMGGQNHDDMQEAVGAALVIGGGMQEHHGAGGAAAAEDDLVLGDGLAEGLGAARAGRAGIEAGARAGVRPWRDVGAAGGGGRLGAEDRGAHCGDHQGGAGGRHGAQNAAANDGRGGGPRGGGNEGDGDGHQPTLQAMVQAVTGRRRSPAGPTKAARPASSTTPRRSGSLASTTSPVRAKGTGTRG